WWGAESPSLLGRLRPHGRRVAGWSRGWPLAGSPPGPIEQWALSNALGLPDTARATTVVEARRVLGRALAASHAAAVVVHGAHEIATLVVALEAAAHRADVAERTVPVQGVNRGAARRWGRRDGYFIEQVGATHPVRTG